MLVTPGQQDQDRNNYIENTSASDDILEDQMHVNYLFADADSRYTQLRKSTIFAENADKQVTLILRYCGIERTIETVMNVYSSQALDPHVNRYRFRDDWWA